MGRRGFGLILLVLITLIWMHLYLRGVRPAELSGQMSDVVLCSIAAMYGYQLLCLLPLVNVRDRPRALIALYLVTGYMFYLWLALLLRELLWVFVKGLALEHDPKALLFSCYDVWLVGTLATLIGVITAWLGPAVRTVRVVLPRWPQALNGFKILQISDLHVGPVIKRRYVERVVRLVMRQAPDLIAVTGDLGDGDPAGLQRDLDPLAELKAKHGVYYVTGNHEYYWGAEKWLQAVTERGMEPLLNKAIEIPLGDGQKLWLAGLPDFTAAHFIPEHRSDLAAISPVRPADYAANVLLVHQPKSYSGAPEAGFELMLCGHTHNGQTFPFNFLVGRFNPFSRGMNKIEQMLVYVNRGSGYWGPPLRLGIRAEISCLVIEGPRGPS